MPPIELGIMAFIAVMVILLLAVRAKRSHDQKVRRAASSGFYDFDLAHYGTASAGSSLMEKAVESGSRPLAPSFSSATREGKGNAAGRAAPATLPSSFATADRPPIGPLPAFDQETAARHRPPGEVRPGLPIPSTPSIPAPTPPPAVERAGTGSSLPLLEQPPPPDSARPA
jgi:hypothetical protein